MLPLNACILGYSLYTVFALFAIAIESRLYRVGQVTPLRWDAAIGQSSSITITAPSALYISVHFRSFNLPLGDRITIRSPARSSEYSYTDLGRGNLGIETSGFHTSFILGAQAIVEYVSSNRTSSALLQPFAAEIDYFIQGHPRAQTSSICGVDNSEPAICFKGDNVKDKKIQAISNQWYAKSLATARLLVNGSFLCTGWLLGSEGHLMTNYHCITDTQAASMVDIEFMAVGETCSEECKRTFACHGRKLYTSAAFISNSELYDYALIKLVKSTELSSFGYLTLRSTGPKLGEAIYIPHYPRGYGLRISRLLDDGTAAIVQTLNGSTACGSNQVGYAADTDVGSSGAPVIAVSDNSVIALHHCGQCENTAVNIKDIIADLRVKKIAVNDMLE
uniref:Uncharacterized protein AlNc14C10G1261 n=1 Tax=Albugo laibachii Nc14 TaxID=890382 RepID=F0W2L4_9STRA|nr:conserved hypothetical protein [Albugo laibachii Nc14]|eukprot:CCA15300.1 conserved hypothetical protein [Albugo laibachii Nc14]